MNVLSVIIRTESSLLEAMEHFFSLTGFDPIFQTLWLTFFMNLSNSILINEPFSIPKNKR